MPTLGFAPCTLPPVMFVNPNNTINGNYTSLLVNAGSGSTTATGPLQLQCAMWNPTTCPSRYHILKDHWHKIDVAMAVAPNTATTQLRAYFRGNSLADFNITLDKDIMWATEGTATSQLNRKLYVAFMSDVPTAINLDVFAFVSSDLHFQDA